MAMTDNLFGIARRVAFVLCVLTLAGCQAPEKTHASRSITVLAGLPKASIDAEFTRAFTEQTGIAVRFIPGSESASRRLEQELAILRQESPAVDVFQIDTIWPAMVANYLLDLRRPLAGEFADESNALIENVTVSGRVVGAPYLIEYGALFYRTDLLRKYGFERPPQTWDELEKQAARIQEGERERGRPEFWGYVWEGADYEGLTCNALEWQYSQGGGNFIEADRTIDIQNPAAIRAFARATKWVGTISPPGVTAYIEEDARNIWQSGRAAFLRNWTSIYSIAEQSKEVRARFGVAPVPHGGDAHSSVLGGWYLGVSKYTRHRDDAIAFVKYLSGRGVQRQRAMEGALPTYPSLYQDAAVQEANSELLLLSDVANRVVRRPSVLAGANYDRVSRAYAHGVHEILTGKATAADGAAAMQAELKRITGFPDSERAVPNSVEKERR